MGGAVGFHCADTTGEAGRLEKRGDRALPSSAMRHPLRLSVAIVVGAAMSAAGLAYGAADRLNDGAQVDRPALRLTVPDNSQLTPEQRAAQDLFAIVNLERMQRGLPVYQWHDQVADAAYAHSVDMAAHNRMQHTGSDGSNAGARIALAGFAWSTWGENIGAGFIEPQPLFDAWLNSSSHIDQLLGDFRYIGIGAVASSDGTPYWTLDVAG